MLAKISRFLHDSAIVCGDCWRWCLEHCVVAALAMAWWGIVAVARILWACRAAALSVLLGAGLIVGTDQARDIVIASGLPSFRAYRIPVAVAIWAILAWYWARLTLSYSFVTAWVDRETGRRLGWCEFWRLQAPRLLGTLAILSLASTNWSAATIHRAAGDNDGADDFNTAGYSYAGYALLFFVVVATRRWWVPWLLDRFADPTGRTARILTPTHAPVTRVVGFDNPAVFLFFSVTTLLAPIVALSVAADPVAMNDVFGGAVPGILLGLALFVPVASVLVILSARLGLPLFAAALLWLVLAPGWFGDIHDVRRCSDLAKSSRPPARCETEAFRTRPSLKQAFFAWWERNAEITPPLGNVTAPPMIVVATAGGASRAAYWTTQVLGHIAEREEHFAERLFMISGVSGGSLGAVTFRSLIEADRLGSADNAGSPRLEGVAKKSDDLIREEFLGPALTTGLYVDVPAGGFAFLLPWRWRPDDRAAALEKAWEASWTKFGFGAGKFDWRDGFNSVFNSATTRPWPILALNGTSVEKGKRIITSNVDFSSNNPGDPTNMSGGINRYDAFDMMNSDIPISTAVTMSARFPLISPTGALRERQAEEGAPEKIWTRVTDGGLFENFGALTADEVIRYFALRASEVQQGPKQIVPIAILISSDPSLDALHLRRDANPKRAIPDCSPIAGNARPDPQPHAGNAWNECPVIVNDFERAFLDPAIALYGGRVARGEAAATALADRIADTRIPVRDRLVARSGRSVDEVQARIGIDDHQDFFHFRQCRLPGTKTPTMSWHDSPGAFEAMKQMLGITPDDKGTYPDHCGNQIEFFRLCVRLERLTGRSADDHAATLACESTERWRRRPDGWDCCVPEPGSRLKRPFCGMQAVEYVTRSGETQCKAP